MSLGFSGAPARQYLKDIRNAMNAAKVAHSMDPFRNLSNRTVTPPALPPRQNVDISFIDSLGNSGSHATGIGNSSNIVVSSSQYASISNSIDAADRNMGVTLINVANAIEKLCDTSYRLPQATPRCREVESFVKASLNGYNSLTESLKESISHFSNNILGIG